MFKYSVKVAGRIPISMLFLLYNVNIDKFFDLPGEVVFSSIWITCSMIKGELYAPEVQIKVWAASFVATGKILTRAAEEYKRLSFDDSHLMLWKAHYGRNYPLSFTKIVWLIWWKAVKCYFSQCLLIFEPTFGNYFKLSFAAQITNITYFDINCKINRFKWWIVIFFYKKYCVIYIAFFQRLLFFSFTYSICMYNSI